MRGLSQQTEQVFEQISRMECIKDYTLIGGTALALQLGHRLSEDLDFCKWRKTRNNTVRIDNWKQIENELAETGKIRKNILDDNHVDFRVNGVKITFFADNEFREPKGLIKQSFLNNIRIADVKSIGIMKATLMLHRNSHRDYYDIYSILKSGILLNDIVSGAANFSEHRLKTKNILAMLLDSKYVKVDKNFQALNPIYDFDLEFLEKEISKMLAEMKN